MFIVLYYIMTVLVPPYLHFQPANRLGFSLINESKYNKGASGGGVSAKLLYMRTKYCYTLSIRLELVVKSGF